MTDQKPTSKATAKILYKVEWEDTWSNIRRNFQSDIPFEHLEIATAKLGCTDYTAEHSSDKPVLEVINSIRGTAAAQTQEEEDHAAYISKLQSLSYSDISIYDVGPTRLVIHSQPLLRVIRGVVKYSPKQALTGDHMEIKEPYAVLVHYQDELKTAQRQLETGIERGEEYTHLTLLLDHLEKSRPENVNLACEKLSRPVPVITFHNLWLLFKPGDDIYYDNIKKLFGDLVCGGVLMSTKVVELDSTRGALGKETYLDVRFWALQCGGSYITKCEASLMIRLFEGEREVTSLPVFPCKYQDARDKGEVRRKLETRGEKVYKVLQAEPKQMWYEGQPYGFKKANYRGPVMLDSATAMVEYDSLAEKDIVLGVLTNEISSKSENANLTDESLEKLPFTEYEMIKLSEHQTLPSRHHYMMLQAWLPGFALNDKTWKLFYVDTLQEMKSEISMRNLVIDQETQDILQAACHTLSNPWRIDYVSNKGEGQVVLLHGPPGVGKTYTVECVAQSTGLPLIALNVADLMLDKDIEWKLMKWFRLAEAWKAILLIDEADIFLERRATRDLERNGTVSIFLRYIEYFKGILFLTTNRVGQIDDAFISRVTVVLQYEHLTDDTRKKIWHGFFDKLRNDMEKIDHSSNKNIDGSSSQQKVEIGKYARDYVLYDSEVKDLQWNGREIRNALQTAISLATYKALQDRKGVDQMIDVEVDHFKSVVRMSKKFKVYVNSITRKGESERARARFDRNDGYGDGKEDY